MAAEKAKNWDKKAALTKQLVPTLKDVAQVLSPLGFKRLQVATFELDMKRLFGTKKQQIKMLQIVHHPTTSAAPGSICGNRAVLL